MSLNGDEQSKRMKKGTVVIALLGALTAIEFLAAVTMDAGLFAALSIIAVVKTWLILDYFMHLTSLWTGEE
jgi:heme/copper-type cytochrome/quinol oxidase subunit 4